MLQIEPAEHVMLTLLSQLWSASQWMSQSVPLEQVTELVQLTLSVSHRIEHVDSDGHVADVPAVITHVPDMHVPPALVHVAVSQPLLPASVPPLEVSDGASCLLVSTSVSRVATSAGAPEPCPAVPWRNEHAATQARTTTHRID